MAENDMEYVLSFPLDDAQKKQLQDEVVEIPRDISDRFFFVPKQILDLPVVLSTSLKKNMPNRSKTI